MAIHRVLISLEQSIAARQRLRCRDAAQDDSEGQADIGIEAVERDILPQPVGEARCDSATQCPGDQVWRYDIGEIAGRDRLLDEARLIAGTEHPHIVPLYEVDRQGNLAHVASGYNPGDEKGLETKIDALLAAH